MCLLIMFCISFIEDAIIETLHKKQEKAICDAITTKHPFINPYLQGHRRPTKQLVTKEVKEHTEKTVRNIVALVGKQFFYSFHDVEMWSTTFMEKVVSCTVEDVPMIMEDLGFVGLDQQVELMDLAVTLENADPKRKNSKVKLAYHLVKSTNPDQKRVIYLDQLQNVCRKKLKLPQEKKKKTKKKKEDSIIETSAPATSAITASSLSSSNASSSLNSSDASYSLSSSDASSSLSASNASSSLSSSNASSSLGSSDASSSLSSSDASSSLRNEQGADETCTIMVKFDPNLVQKVKGIYAKLSSSVLESDMQDVLKVIKAVLEGVKV